MDNHSGPSAVARRCKKTPRPGSKRTAPATCQTCAAYSEAAGASEGGRFEQNLDGQERERHLSGDDRGGKRHDMSKQQGLNGLAI